ncbi:uncharacterized protein LOC110834501 isoform X3 [Zootermopsis nevadensis]|uniref:uncharacterized protein LOC110834501 isoform X3 n=1 Tax=Zootermopsis nevadensis TaxID=136037 RepID=UPI000B8ED3FC|nr:uncharacterized protein LOC110834501 isoform X3 [Zootermopsis nevadensis]
MQLITAVDVIEPVVEGVFIKDLPQQVPQLSTHQLQSKIDCSNRMVKETKGGECAPALPSNDHPNRHIKKPETLNGAPQTSSPIKKIFEMSKSMSFDMTVKKVTIPPQWEKLSLNSTEEHTELTSTVSTNGISHELVCDEKNTAQVPEDGEVQRTSRESVGLDFVEDGEQFGLSDSEVNKLLEDVDDKENPETSNTESGVREKSRIEHSDSDMCNETITAAGDEDMCENSSILSDVVLSHSAKAVNVKSSNSVVDGNGFCNSEHLKNVKVLKQRNDTKVLKTTDKVNDAVEEKTVDNFVDSEREVHIKFVEENKPYGTEISSDVSSHNSSPVERENEKRSVMSPKSGVSHPHPCSDTSGEKEFHCHLLQGVGDEESQGGETGRRKILDGLELLQCGSMEPSEKLSDVEMQNDYTENLPEVGLQNCHNEHNVNSSDTDVQDCSGEKSFGLYNDTVHSDRKLTAVEVQDDQAKLDGLSSVMDDDVGTCDMDYQAGHDIKDDKPDMKLANLKDLETEGDEKLCLLKKESSEAEIHVNVISIHARESNKLQAVSNDIRRTDRAINEDIVLRTENSHEQSRIVSSEKDTSLVEPEHAVYTGEADRFVRKRTSALDSDDGVRQAKRTRVENCKSENLESASECDKKGGNVFGNRKDEEKNKATRFQRQEAVSENREKTSVADKESSGMVKDSETDKDFAEVNREGGERVKEESERNSEVSELYNQGSEADKKGSEKGKEMNDVVNDNANRDTAEGGDTKNSSSKRVYEPVSIIEVKKVHISPDMGKQLKLVDGKNSTAEMPQNEGEDKQERVKSALPTQNKSNVDLAIERVATGVTEEPENPEPPEQTQKLNPMPFMRDLHVNLIKKLSRNELEEFVVQKLCESVTDRCTLGDLRQKCQSLEQLVDQWRKKAQQLQKQNRDMDVVMKRCISDVRAKKERPIPVKITRSVGLQVHMGPPGPGMLRNRTLGSNNLSNPGQQQQQQKQLQQQRQAQSAVRTTSTNPLTVQKVVTPGFTKLASTPTAAPHVPITTLVGPIPASLKMNIVARPAVTTTTTATISTGSVTSTINTVNNIVVNTSNNLRVATASQLNNRQQPNPTVFAPNKPNSDLKVIDLTDEEDRAKTTGIVCPVIATPASITTNLIPSSTVTTAVSISNNPGIQTGSIRVVQPHQLTGTTATTILAPSTPTPPTSRVTYFVPTSGGTVQQRQVLIASSPSPVRPGIMSVPNRPNQLPTLLFKNGTVVPIQQASGTAPVNTTAILRPGPPVQASQLQQVLNPTRPGQQIRVAPSLVTTVGRMTAPALANVSSLLGNKHPAPLPSTPAYQPSNINWKFVPPKPELKISKVANKHQQGIVLSWNLQLTSEYEDIASYQLYAYQEGSAQPSTTLWKKVGDVKALPLPMACTLTQFMEGHKYHFAVRAVDVHTRVGPFSSPGNIVLTRK